MCTFQRSSLHINVPKLWGVWLHERKTKMPAWCRRFASETNKTQQDFNAIKLGICYWWRELHEQYYNRVDYHFSGIYLTTDDSIGSHVTMRAHSKPKTRCDVCTLHIQLNENVCHLFCFCFHYILSHADKFLFI